MIDADAAVRFWERVDRSGGPDACWYWQGRNYTYTTGPAYIKWEGKYQAVYRIAYMLTQGAIPKGLLVRHRCANGGCLNPAHCRLGTRAENNKDTHTRRWAGIPKGRLFTYEDYQL